MNVKDGISKMQVLILKSKVGTVTAIQMSIWNTDLKIGIYLVLCNNIKIIIFFFLRKSHLYSNSPKIYICLSRGKALCSYFFKLCCGIISINPWKQNHLTTTAYRHSLSGPSAGLPPWRFDSCVCWPWTSDPGHTKARPGHAVCLRWYSSDCASWN